MKKLLFALSALAAGCTFASSAPALAAARNYDCSKPGNANKAACKGATKQSTKPKEAKAAPSKPAKETKAALSKPAKETKAAEAPKPPGKPAAKQAAASERHYDCSKAGNANKAACKGTAATTAAAKPAPKPAARPAPKPAAMPKAVPAAKPAPAATSAENNIAAGAIAQCKDGTYSHAKNRRGACSRHGGVGKWMG
jgi:hypothetical protein